MLEEAKDTDLGLFAGPVRPLLHTQTRMLDAVIHKMSGGDVPVPPEWDADVIRVTSLMLQSMGVSIHSVLKITNSKDMSIKDAFGIARSVVELAVNACYILSSGADTARRADRHAMQKTYRDFNRRGEIGGTLIELRRVAIPEIDVVPGLRAALDEFTDKKGREITKWTHLDISARISQVKEINEAAAIALSGATMATYRHSSEMLHGTYFSTVFFWKGSSAFGNEKINFDDRWIEHFTTIFSACYFSCQGVIELFARRYNMMGLVEVQRRMNKNLLAIVEKFELDSTNTISKVD